MSAQISIRYFICSKIQILLRELLHCKERNCLNARHNLSVAKTRVINSAAYVQYKILTLKKIYCYAPLI
jgi:hypothetical protein